jgi:uncharacterized protein (TIGR00645 family)
MEAEASKPVPRAPATSALRRVERAVEQVIFASRWLQTPIYLGLMLTVVVYTVHFMRELGHLFHAVETMAEADLMLAVLTLVDAAMVANLVIMVVMGGYENFVSRLDVHMDADRPAWLGKLDHGSLKIKLATSLVAISSIQLLKAFMNFQSVPNDKLMWLVVIHLTFVVSALLLAHLDRLASKH